MNQYAYVLTLGLLTGSTVDNSVATALRLAKAAKPDEEAIAAAIKGWTVKVGGEEFSVGMNLASIVRVSEQNRRTGVHPAGHPTELQVRRVSYPRPLSKLLRDLEKGRAIAIVLSGVRSVEVVAWCIIDTAPASASEAFVRDRLDLIEEFPYYNKGATSFERGEQAGVAPLRFEETGEVPKAATIIQIYRSQSFSGWSALPRPKDLNKGLSEKLWEVVVPYLTGLGIELLIGEMLHAINGDPVFKIGKLPPGWSFYSSNGFRPTGVLETHAWANPDGSETCKLTYEIMVAPVGLVALSTPWGSPAQLTRITPDEPRAGSRSSVDRRPASAPR